MSRLERKINCILTFDCGSFFHSIRLMLFLPLMVVLKWLSTVMVMVMVIRVILRLVDDLIASGS